MYLTSFLLDFKNKTITRFLEIQKEVNSCNEDMEVIINGLVTFVFFVVLPTCLSALITIVIIWVHQLSVIKENQNFIYGTECEIVNQLEKLQFVQQRIEEQIINSHSEVSVSRQDMGTQTN